MKFTRNKRDTNDRTLINQLVNKGGDVEYLEGIWIWDSKEFNSLQDVAQDANIPQVTTNFQLESYS